MDAETVPAGIAVSHDITGNVGGLGCARTPMSWVCPFSVMFGQLLPETIARARTLPPAPICVQVAMMSGDPCAKQEEMAEILGVSASTVSNWENGRVSVKSAFLAAWAQITGFNMSSLMPTPGEVEKLAEQSSDPPA